jgi:hypothetical protein
MEKISWTDRVRDEKILYRINKGRNIIHTIQTRKADLIGHILRMNCLIKHIVEGKIEG